MSRKSKIDPIIKIRTVEEYLCDRIRLSKAAAQLSIDKKTVSAWVAIYRNEGPAGLLEQKHNKHYSKE
ncbi:MAG: helix-turn-helix domain-containing protein, partial [Eubacterium sp.]|nr:helix-turn-helix domain-containing protein [Eubacterium sp.]